MKKQTTKETGNKGERAAAELLARKGYVIVARNWRNKWGEVDIIAKTTQQTNKPTREQVVVFVEVKTKTGQRYGEPWEMVNQWKVQQVTRMGELWCAEYGWRGLCRVDVVGVWMDEITGEVVKSEHWENVAI